MELDTQQKLVPELRFSEFESDWIKVTLGDVGTFKNGINKDKKDFGHGVPFVNLMDVFGKDSISELNLSLVNANKKETQLYNLLEGDVLFIRSSVKKSGVGETALVLKDIPNTVYSGFLIRYRSDKGIFHNLFKKYCFWTSSFRKSLISYSTTSANTNINQESLNQLSLFIPTTEEQQKIASFFNTIDKKISQLSNKIEEFELFKKGVTQKIFSQELRFKDEYGNEFPKWGKKKLGELTFKVGKKNKENISYPIYSINNQEGFLPQSEQFDGLDSNDRGYDISLYKIVNEKTFAYNPARINVGSIGYSYDLNSVIVSSLYVCFKTKEDLEDRFLLTYLDTDRFNKDILRYQEGGVRQYLFFENFSQIPISLPCCEEQIKIANFLEIIDQKINKTKAKLEETRNWKKGLLQKMFV